ncbi:MAG TPA: FoF1 ATP synthase subunit gamma [Candidatus Nanoarchaeia archaeon]
MSSQRELQGDLAAIGAIKTISSVYQEIASFRMKQLRNHVAKTREFLDGVASVYNRAKAAYIASMKEILFAKQGKKLPNLAFIRRNGRRVDVFLSANEHLYGTLILDVWEHYLKDIKEGKNDAVVIGSFGRYLINNEKLDIKIANFDLDDDKPESAQIKKIIDFISQYEKVVVYHGQMVSVLNQIPAKSEITGGMTYGEKIQRGVKRYLFEPSPEKVLEFFEAEIIGALFNQTVLEHQLARFAARMVAMDQATENANEEIKRIEKQLRALRRRILNRKQQEIFAGYHLWISEDEIE